MEEQRPRRRLVGRERIEHIGGQNDGNACRQRKDRANGRVETNAKASRQRKDRAHRRVEPKTKASRQKGQVKQKDKEQGEGQSSERIDQILQKDREQGEGQSSERIDQIDGQRTRRRIVVIERIEQIEGQRLRRRLVVSHLKVMCVCQLKKLWAAGDSGGRITVRL